MSGVRASKRVSGFTLIELMITVAIIAILAGIALPAYNSQIVKSRRTDAQRALIEYAQSMERYFTVNGRYSTAAGGTTCGGAVPKAASLYSLGCAATDTTFTVTAMPTTGTGQASDGNQSLTNAGVRTGKWAE